MPDRDTESAATASPFTVTLPSDDRVSAIAYRTADAPPAGTTMVLAHGAGAPQTHPFMTAFAHRLSRSGIDVVTFNFLYRERGRRVPDPKARLEACYRAAIAAARARTGDGNRMVIGGKVDGRPHRDAGGGRGRRGRRRRGRGRPSCFSATRSTPPGRPDKPRTAHLPSVTAPMLFVQGGRDVFGTPDELRPVLATCADAELVTVDGGDHSFKRRGKNAPPAEEIYETVTGRIVRWLSKRGLQG